MSTIPIDAMRKYRPSAVPEGQLSIVVARQQSAGWPDAETRDYAAQRSALLHQLVDVDGVEIRDWGQTDAEQPREVVEILIAVIGASIPAIATIIAAWIGKAGRTTNRAADNAPSAPAAAAVTPAPVLAATVAGIKITKPDGTQLEMTLDDRQRAGTRRKIVREFMQD